MKTRQEYLDMAVKVNAFNGSRRRTSNYFSTTRTGALSTGLTGEAYHADLEKRWAAVIEENTTKESDE